LVSATKPLVSCSWFSDWFFATWCSSSICFACSRAGLPNFSFCTVCVEV
jgi:hypothetical protein